MSDLFVLFLNEGVIQRHILTSVPTPSVCLHDSLAFTRNKWPPPNFKAGVAIRMVFIYGTCQFSLEWKTSRDVVHHYSNQGSSISQTKNRLLEQIENVLFQSDSICAAIYLRSKGTIIEKGGRKCLSSLTNMKGLEIKKTRGKKMIEIIFDLQPLNTPLQKVTSANATV